MITPTLFTDIPVRVVNRMSCPIREGEGDAKQGIAVNLTAGTRGDRVCVGRLGIVIFPTSGTVTAASAAVTAAIISWVSIVAVVFLFFVFAFICAILIAIPWAKEWVVSPNLHGHGKAEQQEEGDAGEARFHRHG